MPDFTALTNFVQQATTTTLILRLGTVTFQGFELPDRFEYLGGEQMTALHQMVGGKRIVQPLGPIPPEMITWRGVMLGTDAFFRCQQVDRMRVSGLEQILVYGPWRWRVIVKSFKGTADHQFRVPYEIRILPIEDLTETVPAPQVSNESLFKQAGLQVQNMVSVQQGLPVPVLPSGTLVQIQSATQTFMDALRAAGGVFSNMSSGVRNTNLASVTSLITTLGALAGEPGVTQTGVTTLTSFQAISAAEDLASYMRMFAFYARTVPPQPKIRRMVNPNLYELAVQEYGDVNQYQRLMTANNLFDPMPIGRYQIVIPLP